MVDRLAEALWKARASGEVVAIGPGMAPATPAAAYEVQAAMIKLAGLAQVGWKIGGGEPARPERERRGYGVTRYRKEARFTREGALGHTASHHSGVPEPVDAHGLRGIPSAHGHHQRVRQLDPVRGLDFDGQCRKHLTGRWGRLGIVRIRVRLVERIAAGGG